MQGGPRAHREEGKQELTGRCGPPGKDTHQAFASQVRPPSLFKLGSSPGLCKPRAKRAGPFQAKHAPRAWGGSQFSRLWQAESRKHIGPLQAQCAHQVVTRQFSGPLQAQSETRRAFSSQARPPSLCGSQFSGPLQAESITRRAFASPVRPPIKAVLRAFASPQRTQPAFASRLRPPSLTAQRFSGPLQAQSVRTEFSSFGTPAGPVWGRRQFSGPFQAQSVRPY